MFSVIRKRNLRRPYLRIPCVCKCGPLKTCGAICAFFMRNLRKTLKLRRRYFPLLSLALFQPQPRCSAVCEAIPIGVIRLKFSIGFGGEQPIQILGSSEVETQSDFASCCIPVSEIFAVARSEWQYSQIMERRAICPSRQQLCCRNRHFRFLYSIKKLCHGNLYGIKIYNEKLNQ
jgi:hypothetical protein